MDDQLTALVVEVHACDARNRLYILTKWQRFPAKACIFLEGYQKNKKNQRFWSSGLAFAQTLKSLFFFGTSSRRFPAKACIFLEGYQKNKKNKDFALFRPRLRQDSKIFVFFCFCFFGTSSGNGNVFQQKLAFSWRGTKKTKKTKILDSQASPSPRL